MFGKLAHLIVDAILISACLAGIRRSTGLSLSIAKVPSKDLRQLLLQYLALGEYSLDAAIMIMGQSNYFVRKR